MGNSIVKFICGNCFKPQSSDSLGPHGVTSENVGVSALAHDLLHFDATSQVPEGLSQHVVSSKKAQANWYNKLLVAWREAKPPPRTAEDATRLIVLTLKNHQKADVEGLLSFYRLPASHALDTGEGSSSPTKADGVKYQLLTLPVDMKSIADGDTITVYVDAADPRESSIVPPEVHKAVVSRARARAVKDYKTADALHKSIVDAGYRVISSPNGDETLAKKYRIRLKGIDAPESAMPYGKESKEELVKLVEGKRLKVNIYGSDQYGRFVGDVYFNNIFIQEKMLKKGFAWHYPAYDQRPEFAAWEKEARNARRGLWATSNPEKPWEWRKNRRN